MRFLPLFGTSQEGYGSFSIVQDGAHLACWVNVEDPGEARQKAEALIAQSDWEIETIQDEHAVTREGYEGSSEGLQYYEQALIDDEVLVVFTFPNDQSSA